MNTNSAPATPPDDEPRWGLLTMREARAGNGSHAIVPGWWAAIWSRRFVAAHFPELLHGWRVEDNDGFEPHGRRPLIPDVVYLVLCMLLVLEGQPVNPSTVAHMLEHRLSAAAKQALGIAHLYDKRRDWYHIAYRGMHRIIDLWDGWVAPRVLMLLDERNAIRAARDENHTAKMRRRGETFIQKLIDLVNGMQPEEHQRTHLALSVDQTSVRAGSQRSPWRRNSDGEEIRRWNSETGEEVDRPVLELEAGLYPREKGSAVRDPNGAKKFAQSEWEMVFMANIIVDTHEDPTADNSNEPPRLIFAASLGSPNHRIKDATLDLLDSIQRRGYVITRLTFDRGYNHLSGFHAGLRDRGIPNVQDYTVHQKGISNGVGGAKFVEGDYFCPGTAPELLDATVRYDEAEGAISESGWRADKDELYKFALHLHDIKPNGKVRLSCPALGPSATVYCPAREAHIKAFRGKQEPGQVHPQNLPARWPDTPVCCQDSITIDPNDHLQEQQLLRYGSDEWIAVYRTDRNTIESTNDKMKSDFALDLNTERRMRGLAATQLVFAFKIAGLNYKRIADHARDQRRKEERAKQKTSVTPIHTDVNPVDPDSAPTSPPKRTAPVEKKTRSRDRNGWSNYRRNPKKIITVTEEPERPEPPNTAA